MLCFKEWYLFHTHLFSVFQKVFQKIYGVHVCCIVEQVHIDGLRTLPWICLFIEKWFMLRSVITEMNCGQCRFICVIGSGLLAVQLQRFAVSLYEVFSLDIKCNGKFGTFADSVFFFSSVHKLLKIMQSWNFCSFQRTGQFFLCHFYVFSLNISCICFIIHNLSVEFGYLDL